MRSVMRAMDDWYRALAAESALPSDSERQLRDNKISAMLVIPAGFTRSYFASTNAVTLELVKNPAESINPAVLEELLGAAEHWYIQAVRALSPGSPAGVWVGTVVKTALLGAVLMAWAAVLLRRRLEKGA